jgi:excisionase family DNA binding protein
MALTVEEAATVLRLSRCTVLDLIEAKKLRVKRVGRRVLVPVRAIDEFLNACE